MNSRERILDAAIPIFAEKGRHGARMEEIAAFAHINKAMIYYIFKNKDGLYFEVLKFIFERAQESLSTFSQEYIEKGKSYVKILSDYISAQFTFFNENRNYTKILVDAMSSSSEEIRLAVKQLKARHNDNENTIIQMRQVFEKGKTEKIFRNIDTNQLMISIMGMVIVYFLSHSITEAFDIEVKDESTFMESRRKSIIDIVLHGIMN